MLITVWITLSLVFMNGKCILEPGFDSFCCASL